MTKVCAPTLFVQGPRQRDKAYEPRCTRTLAHGDNFRAGKSNPRAAEQECVNDTGSMHRLVWLVAPEVMKTTPTFKGSWFGLAMVAAILAWELVACHLSTRLGFVFNPITVAFG